MVLSLFYSVTNALGDTCATCEYRLSCQTVLALEQHRDFSALPKMVTKTQPCVAKSVTGNDITAAGAGYPKHTTVQGSLCPSVESTTNYFTFYCHFSMGLCGTYCLSCTVLKETVFSGFVLLTGTSYINSQSLTLPFLIMWNFDCHLIPTEL